uniref:Uncharacterized protein n=1 Tax=viral metagenome TaxID=1070528 RepID=A0A6M3KCF9_9ZZZZ
MTEFVVSIFLVVLAGDLLYLYYRGASLSGSGWQDPSRLIELLELGCLYVLGIGGIVNCIRVAVEVSR